MNTIEIICLIIFAITLCFPIIGMIVSNEMFDDENIIPVTRHNHKTNKEEQYGSYK